MWKLLWADKNLNSYMKKINKTFIVLFLAFIINSCGSTGGSDSPANAVKDFVQAVKEQNMDKAWAQLSSKSQQDYTQRAKNRNQSGKDLFSTRFKETGSLGILSSDFQIVEEKKEDEATALVVVKNNRGETSDMYTVKENNVWKLDYSKSEINIPQEDESSQ